MSHQDDDYVLVFDENKKGTASVRNRTSRGSITCISSIGMRVGTGMDSITYVGGS